MKVPHFLRAVLVTPALLVLSTCMPGNDNSIVDRPLANDPRLIGVWLDAGAKKQEMIIGVQAETPEILFIDLAFFSQSSGIIRYQARRTRIGARDILELEEIRIASVGPKIGEWTLPNRFFLAYAFDGDNRLLVYLQTRLTTALDAAVRDGRLPGRKETRGRDSRTIVTASTADLRAFIAATPDLFSEPPVTYARVGKPKRQ